MPAHLTILFLLPSYTYNRKRNACGHFVLESQTQASTSSTIAEELVKEFSLLPSDKYNEMRDCHGNDLPVYFTDRSHACHLRPQCHFLRSASRCALGVHTCMCICAYIYIYYTYISVCVHMHIQGAWLE